MCSAFSRVKKLQHTKSRPIKLKQEGQWTSPTKWANLSVSRNKASFSLALRIGVNESANTCNIINTTNSTSGSCRFTSHMWIEPQNIYSILLATGLFQPDASFELFILWLRTGDIINYTVNHLLCCTQYLESSHQRFLSYSINKTENGVGPVEIDPFQIKKKNGRQWHLSKCMYPDSPGLWRRCQKISP